MPKTNPNFILLIHSCPIFFSFTYHINWKILLMYWDVETNRRMLSNWLTKIVTVRLFLVKKIAQKLKNYLANIDNT